MKRALLVALMLAGAASGRIMEARVVTEYPGGETVSEHLLIYDDGVTLVEEMTLEYGLHPLPPDAKVDALVIPEKVVAVVQPGLTRVRWVNEGVLQERVGEAKEGGEELCPHMPAPYVVERLGTDVLKYPDGTTATVKILHDSPATPSAKEFALQPIDGERVYTYINGRLESVHVTRDVAFSVQPKNLDGEGYVCTFVSGGVVSTCDRGDPPCGFTPSCCGYVHVYEDGYYCSYGEPSDYCEEDTIWPWYRGGPCNWDGSCYVTYHYYGQLGCDP